MMKNSAFLSAFVTILLVGPSSPAPSAIAQQPAHPKLAFDVATIHLSPPPDPARIRADVQAGKLPRFGPHVTASRAEYIGMPLKDLIALAYRLRGYQVNGPDWLSSERFDIVATMPEGATRDDAPAMLRALLEDRFKMSAHKDTEEHKVLALLVGKNGSKLKKSTTTPEPVDENAPLKPNEITMDGPDGLVRMTRNPDGSMLFDLGTRGTVAVKLNLQDQALRIESSMVTMGGFTDTLSAILAQMGGQQVVDMTGLKGNYEIGVEIALADLMAMAGSPGVGPPPAGGPATGGPASGGPVASDPGGGASIFQSVKQLGLELDERKAPVERLVIDHIEKMPTEN
jgi:uncharacterized protein (TIGR03435 family)